MTNTDLGTIVRSNRIRTIIYSTFVIAVLIAGAFEVAFAAVDVSQPDWLVIAVKVLAYLGIPVGTLAAVNVTDTARHVKIDE